jgi:hypothetical protein
MITQGLCGLSQLHQSSATQGRCIIAQEGIEQVEGLQHTCVAHHRIALLTLTPPQRG